MATAKRVCPTNPIYVGLTRIYEIYKKLINGGLQHSIEAPEQFHQPLNERWQKLPAEFQKTILKTEWVSVTLLADGDVTLFISADFINQHSPQIVEQKVQELLGAINEDVKLFRASIQQFACLVKFIIEAASYTFIAKSLLSALFSLGLLPAIPVWLTEWLSTLSTPPAFECLILLALWLLNRLRPMITSWALKLVFEGQLFGQQ